MMTAALLWQAAQVSPIVTSPEHLRYERGITVQREGQTCAVLDAQVFAHAASRSGDDLRVFRAQPGGASPVETPFALTESEVQPSDAEPATVQNLGLRNGVIVFDLEMPPRVYSTIDLQLAAKNFIGTAKVWGLYERGKEKTALGTFALFDLSGQRLSRSTELPLQESTFALIHVELQMRSMDGAPLRGVSAAMVEGATVPPSREAQTLYTTVAATTRFVTAGRQSVAKVALPAHVPVERITFVTPKEFHGNFMRLVTVTARPAGSRNDALTETVSGEISEVTLPQTAAVSEKDASLRKMSLDAAFGANLRDGAELEAVIENGDDAPLPLESMQVEMRQRKICFEASSGGSYSLLYGDDALPAPVYDYAKTVLSVQRTPMAEAVLGPEQMNPKFVARVDERTYSERHPETVWIGLLVAVVALGATALRSVKRQGRKS